MSKKKSKKSPESAMLVNVVEEEEARVAILENGRLEDMFIERASRDRIVGNIHKAVVVNVAPSIEAAFIEFGYRKHGFLHASDVRPAFAHSDEAASEARNGNRDIVEMLKPGDELLVQVTKEGINDKGPALTTYVSLPGRYLVLMPGASLRGVSRRITDEDERLRIRDILKSLDVPPEMGVIARTAAVGHTANDFARDLDYLVRLWGTITRRADESEGPGALYRESDHVIRVIRDMFREDIRRIWVDSEDVYERVRDFLREVMPHHVRKVKLHRGEQPLFYEFGVEAELETMHKRRVPLPCGGGIVIDQTEALVAVDVNSGKANKGRRDAEESALKINLEAAREIARQIRLRDLGGVLVLDFIDMEDAGRRTQVEEALWEALKPDKARIRMLKMSAFCLVEMTRQRRRASLRQTTYIDCPTCRGLGFVKSTETLALEIVRRVRAGLTSGKAAVVDVNVPPAVANYLNNAMRQRLTEIEEETAKQVHIHADPGCGPHEHTVTFKSADGSPVKV